MRVLTAKASVDTDDSSNLIFLAAIVRYAPPLGSFTDWVVNIKGVDHSCLHTLART